MLKKLVSVAFTTVVLGTALFAADMQISSPAFGAGASIPSKYTCEGAGINPALRFSNVPPAAKSLALIVEDPDVPKTMIPTGVFDHWVDWGISPKSKGIAEGEGKQGVNGTGKPGFMGPCPPDREHRYFFRLYALDVDLKGADIKDRKGLEDAMKGHIIAQAELMGKYDKMKK